MLNVRDHIDLPLKGRPTLRIQRHGAVRTDSGIGDVFTMGLLDQTDPPTYEILWTLIVIADSADAADPDAIIFPISLDDKLGFQVIIGAKIDNGEVVEFHEGNQKIAEFYLRLWMVDAKGDGYF